MSRLYSQEGEDLLDAAIKQHIGRFMYAETSLGQKARTLSRLALYIKLSVILFGLLVTVRDSVDQLFGASNSLIIAIYVVVGLLIAGLTAVETTFKLEERSAKIRTLATDCRSDRLVFKDRLVSITTNGTDGEISAKKQQLLNDLLPKLIEIQKRATALKIDLHDIVPPESRRGGRDGRTH